MTNKWSNFLFLTCYISSLPYKQKNDLLKVLTFQYGEIYYYIFYIKLILIKGKIVTIFCMFSTAAENNFKCFGNMLCIIYVHALIKILNIYTEKGNKF